VFSSLWNHSAALAFVIVEGAALGLIPLTVEAVLSHRHPEPDARARYRRRWAWSHLTGVAVALLLGAMVGAAQPGRPFTVAGLGISLGLGVALAWELGSRLARYVEALQMWTGLAVVAVIVELADKVYGFESRGLVTAAALLVLAAAAAVLEACVQRRGKVGTTFGIVVAAELGVVGYVSGLPLLAGLWVGVGAIGVFYFRLLTHASRERRTDRGQASVRDDRLRLPAFGIALGTALLALWAIFVLATVVAIEAARSLVG
jgi:hypothetical protein